MKFFKTLSLIFIFFIHGCASFGSGTVDKELGSMLPKEAALRIVNSHIKMGDDLKLIGAGLGSYSCNQLPKPGAVSDIRSALYMTWTSGHRTLRISLDHPSNSFSCGSAIFVRNIPEEEVPLLLTALKSLGAPIEKYSIIRYNNRCPDCKPIL
jgi:hypothetical protein